MLTQSRIETTGDPNMQELEKVFYNKIKQRFHDGDGYQVTQPGPEFPDFDPNIELPDLSNYGDPTKITEADNTTPEEYDKYVSAMVKVPLGDEQVIGKVNKRKRDGNGNPVGIRHSNLLLNTKVYEVKLPYGSMEDISANAIAKNVYAKCDDDGFMFHILRKIINHRKTKAAVEGDNAFIKSRSGKKQRNTTTR